MKKLFSFFHRKGLVVPVFVFIFIFLSAGVFSSDKEHTVPLPEEILFGIPAESDQVITRKGFSLGYSYRYRQAVWVAYILTEENLQMKKVKRISSFRVDPAVRYAPVRPKDYAKTGYDKGHLAPAADMAYSIPSMKNSFFMSNISPQIPGCNRGIWKRVEKQVRKWALKEKKLCIITGPVFFDSNKLMGNTAIAVPTAFYKVILDMTPPMKMIAFIVPNETSRKRLFSFAVSVDK
ncbi:MAG: DNA/RNA non-specific endonuclease, partial [Lentisphaeria bacterium]|nr:DNA/RNA non-specific endonuclease [Lentisphaeria bacterium]